MESKESNRLGRANTTINGEPKYDVAQKKTISINFKDYVLNYFICFLRVMQNCRLFYLVLIP